MSEVAAPDLPVSARVIQVEAQADHLNSLARAKPINALAELIWNALDAYADVVHINVADNELNTPTHIEIVDNGLGIQLSDAERAFGNLGGSLQQREGSASK
ncbi:ATP-binding protein [Ramlibacter lithotrophicus]|nr:ATP-binding protein [Ramlibacter lithotrophicus]